MNVRHCEGLFMASLQMKFPSDYSLSEGNFFPVLGFYHHHHLSCLKNVNRNKKV